MISSRTIIEFSVKVFAQFLVCLSNDCSEGKQAEAWLVSDELGAGDWICTVPLEDIVPDQVVVSVSRPPEFLPSKSVRAR